MIARKYTKRFELYQTNNVADGYGGYTVSTELIAESWCNIKTVPNNSKYVGRMTDLGITDPTTAIIVNTRYRNDINYNAINQFIKYNGKKYIIQNAPTNVDLQGVEIEIIATLEATNSVPDLDLTT